MKNNEIMESVKLNEKGKKTALVLVLAASFLAAVAAFFGFLGGRKSQKSGIKRASTAGAGKRTDTCRNCDKIVASEKKHAQFVSKRSKTVQEEKAADVTEAAAPIVVQQPAVVSQPVYVVRPVPEKKRESKAKRFVRRMCMSVAAILVLSVLYSDMIQYVTPPQILAKESFSGIGRVVSEHTDTPYVILDIVPNKATVSGQEFSMGTLGYFVSGQEPVAQDLKRIFSDAPDTYKEWTARKALVSTVLNAGSVEGSKIIGSNGIVYEERYEGISYSIPESNGWTKAFDNGTGVFYGRWELVEDGMGDFEAPDWLLNAVSLSRVRALDPYATTRVKFELNADGAYKIGQVMDWGEYADSLDTLVYYWDDSANAFVCAGFTVGQLLESIAESEQGSTGEVVVPKEEEPKEEEPEEEEPNEDGDENDGELGDGDDIGDGGNVGDVDNTGDGGNVGDGGNTGDGGNVGDGGNTGDGGNVGDVDNTGDGGNVGDGDNTGDGDNSSNLTISPTITESEDGTPVASIANDRNALVSGRWYMLVENEVEEPAEEVGSSGSSNSDEVNSNDSSNNEEVNSSNNNSSNNEAVDSNNSSNNEDNWWSKYVVITFELNYDEEFDGPLYDIADGWSVDENIGASTAALPASGGIPVLTYDNVGDIEPFQYVGEGEGNCKLIPLASSKSNSSNADAEADSYEVKTLATPTSGEGWIKVEGVNGWIRCYSECSDYLKRYVFSTLSGGDNENSDFKIKVITKRADEVSPDDVFSADLIYLESGNNTWINNGTPSCIMKDSDEDMGDSVVNAILYRATQDLMPIIVDYGVSEGGSGSTSYDKTNYAYLGKSLLKQDFAEFYEAMDQKDDKNLMANIKLYYDNGSNDYPDKERNDKGYVNQNVYVVDGNALVSESFREGGLTSGFAEVLAAIKAENTLLSDDDKISEDVSPAKAVQYIINYSVGIVGEFDDLTILELQPTANRTSDLKIESNGTYTKLLWKTDAMSAAKQILSSKKDFSVYQNVKSVAEFNGEWEDINSNYDIIFIGLDGQRLYRDGDAERTARYNNSSLNGKVYHPGDDSGAGRYDANDITAQKMTELLNYMEAGYPVLVENNCFKNESAQKAGDGDVNDKYIDRDSVMYRFLNTAVTDDRYKDYIFTVSDAMASPLFMTQVRISRPRIHVYGEDGDKVQSLMADENGDYHGTIAYSITDNRGDAYYNDTVIHLYADYNYDGIFAPEEEVGEYTNDGGMIEVIASDMGPGILPWKLEVTDAGNAYRRDSEQGYFVLGASSAGELKVLQITEQTNDDRVSLQRIYNNKDDSLLAYYLRGAANSTNSEFIFETVNAARLEDELGKNAKYLEQWDVVVMTLDGGVASQVVNDAVTSYADAGRSLLVCAQGLEDDINSGINRLGLSAELLGQRERDLTYTALGASSASQYLRYAGLNRDMFGRQVSLQAETVNEGSISYYPYRLGNSTLAFGQRGWLRPPTYLLDFDNNLSSESNATYVTAWYTFGSGSEESQFGISPKDARNNYYCYSKGNVVYLAQSEYPYTYNSQDIASANGEGADESKLFVNALMAAYSAGVHNANVHIVAGFAADSADVESIPVPFDQDWLEAAAEDGSDGMLDNTVDVYFRFRDSNMAKNKTVQIEFLREEPSGVDLLGIGVNMVPFSSQIWAVKDGRLTLVEPDQLVPGQTYRIKAPVVNMQNNSDKNKADIYVVIRTTFMRGGKECSVTSYDVVSLNRAELRPLE
ncbi:MAG: DUF5057 domain-containing protein [Lachnospiraceae bacterium]|nr:DUF5057 domain-containing protein [Lachnospiraceae bacterium]